mmetsp:Transcript_37713/g.87101  ORF Transcript_37713/g.87101 Transcript_37713/m.87101 type:complete len:350 (+) Transcript_37713:78-1127(+)
MGCVQSGPGHAADADHEVEHDSGVSAAWSTGVGQDPAILRVPGITRPGMETAAAPLALAIPLEAGWQRPYGFEDTWCETDAVARRLQALEDEALAHRLALEEQEAAWQLGAEDSSSPSLVHDMRRAPPSLATRLTTSSGGPESHIQPRTGHLRTLQGMPCRRCGRRDADGIVVRNRCQRCQVEAAAGGSVQDGCEFCGAVLRRGGSGGEPFCWACAQVLRPGGRRAFGPNVLDTVPRQGLVDRSRPTVVAPLVELLTIVSQERHKATPAQASDVAALPTHELPRGASLGDQTRCLICLDDFKATDCLTTMPCLHMYHQKCIEKWLHTSNSCPVCKTSIGGERNGRHTST